MKRRLKILLYFLITLIIIIIGVFDFPIISNYMTNIKNNEADDGTIDLSDVDLSESNYTLLFGQWEFYWNKLLVTDNIEEREPDLLVKVPSYWKDYTINGTKLKGGGYASYRVLLKNVNSSEPIIICVPNLPAAYKVYLNGQLILSSGTLSKTPSGSKASIGFQAVPTVINTDELPDNTAELIIEVSCQFSGGISLTPIIADYDSYSTYVMSIVGLRFMFIGIFLLLSIISLSVAYSLKENYRYLGWLAILCFSLIIRLLISSEGFLVSEVFLKDINYEIMNYLIYVSTFIIKLILFIYTSKFLSLKMQQSISFLFGVYFLVYAAIPVLFTDSVFDPSSFVILQLSTFLFDAFILYNICAAIADKVKNAFAHAFGYVAIVIGIGVDVMYINGYIDARISWFMPLMFLVFISSAVYIHAKLIIENYQEKTRSVELSNEISELNTSLMLSQIQPHFLYNALNTIKYLTKKNPKSAESAIVNFSNYLRANMDSLSQREPIPFLTELNHVKNYAAIELLRFEDRLHIVYDIQCTAFLIPALTVQPLVENSIKHGVNQKANGGTVTVSTYEDENNFYVSVADDGIGYDITASPDGSRSHIGLDNITARLKRMLNASIDINSRLGYGTTVIITIPKSDKSTITEEKKNEDNGGR